MYRLGRLRCQDIAFFACAGQDKDVVLTTRLELIQRAAEESLQAYGESDDIATLHWKIQE